MVMKPHSWLVAFMLAAAPAGLMAQVGQAAPAVPAPAPVVALTPLPTPPTVTTPTTIILPVRSAVHAESQPTVWLEDMTWLEIRDAVKSGKTIALVPTGGTEQNGPHIVLGKHNLILRYTAMTIAERLGNALVAPILPYVPEGDLNPPSGNMRFPGTMMLTDATFGAVLEDIAVSLKAAGFKTICFIGEHGGSQQTQADVAAKLNALWKDEGVQVLHINEYYDEHNGQNKWLSEHGEMDPDPQAHGGLADTSEMLAAHPQGVRDKLRGNYKASDMEKLGVEGPSTRASRSLGAELIELKVRGAVAQIQRLTH